MILGLGITFELPILVFFLALFGIVTAGWLWRNIRYAILIIFIISAIITPTPDVLTMCDAGYTYCGKIIPLGNVISDAVHISGLIVL